MASISYATEIQYRGQYDRVECYSFWHSVSGYSSLLVSMCNVHLCTIVHVQQLFSSASVGDIMAYRTLSLITPSALYNEKEKMFLPNKDWYVVGYPCFFLQIYRLKVKR